MQTPRNEFTQALKALATDVGLEPEVFIQAAKEGVIAAWRRDAKERGEETEGLEAEAQMDPGTGETRIFAYPEGKPEEKKDVTPPGFGRIAAQTAKQVIHQKIKEAERGAVMGDYEGKVGSLVSGMILRFDGPNVRVDLGKTEGLMPASERIPNERLDPNQRLSFLLKEIEDGPRGKQIILSRADDKFIEKLFAREVPEIASGNVKVEKIAREPGVRTKIAVSSIQQGVDPVGSCVGQRGVRVQAVTDELGGNERIDIISWVVDPEELIKASLSPVEVAAIKFDKKTNTAQAMVAEDQLSIAIGREGQNVKLASEISGWEIEVVGDAKLNKMVETVKPEETKEVEKVVEEQQ